MKKIVFNVKDKNVVEQELNELIVFKTSRNHLKKHVDAFTEQYIIQRIRELDEELTDLATELTLYLAKTELDDYEKLRKKF